MKNRIAFVLIISFVFGVLNAQEKEAVAKKTIVSDPVIVTYKKKPVETVAPADDKTNANNKQPAANQATDKLDTIIKLGGKKLICNVQKVNPTNVVYQKPGQTIQLEMQRKDIEKIIYRTGRKEVFNKPVLQMIDQSSWEAVLVTDNPMDVQGLYKRGFVSSNASSGSRSPKAAKTSATIRLQKKTAKLGALIVLVTNSESKGGYGEIPGWELDGIAYSDTPPADTSAVAKAIQAAMDRRNKVKQKDKLKEKERLEKEKAKQEKEKAKKDKKK